MHNILPNIFGGLAILIPLVYLAIFLFATAAGIYCFILFVKLAKRGIEALDIYIDKNRNKRENI